MTEEDQTLEIDNLKLTIDCKFEYWKIVCGLLNRCHENRVRDDRRGLIEAISRNS